MAWTVLPLASALVAQTTTPAGFAGLEGNTGHRLWWAQVVQGIDATNPAAAVWTQIAFRRDASHRPDALLGSFPNRVQVRMGPSDWRRTSPVFDDNFTRVPTVVYPAAVTMSPDWSGSGSTPRPFDFVLPFQAPYVHAGGDFVWELDMTLFIDYYRPFDMEMVPFQDNYGVRAGNGCLINGRELGLATSFASGDPRFGVGAMVLTVSGFELPPAAPTLLMLDVVDRSLRSPVLCAPVSALAVTVPVGAPDVGGWLSRVFPFAHLPSLVGITLHSQLLCVSPQQPPLLPLALTSPSRVVVPASNLGSHRASAVIGSRGFIGGVQRGGCLIAELR